MNHSHLYTLWFRPSRVMCHTRSMTYMITTMQGSPLPSPAPFKKWFMKLKNKFSLLFITDFTISIPLELHLVSDFTNLFHFKLLLLTKVPPLETDACCNHLLTTSKYFMYMVYIHWIKVYMFYPIPSSLSFEDWSNHELATSEYFLYMSTSTKSDQICFDPFLPCSFPLL